MMLRGMLVVQTCIGIVASAACALGQERTGVISGRVMDETGAYVAGAKVHAEPSDGRRPSGLQKDVKADKDGYFRLNHLEWGVYKVFARKEDAYYPDTYWSLYDDGRIVEAQLSEAVQSASVLIMLGPKAGRIQSTVVDAVTGKAIPSAGLRIWQWDDAGRYIHGIAAVDGGRLAPSVKKLGVEVDAPGYQTWRYSGTADSSEGKPLVLKPGEDVTLTVRLQPTSH